MEKLNPKKCPFCGEETVTEIRSGSVCYVRCNSCKAEGPLVDIEEIRDIDSLTLENWMDTVNKMRLKAIEKWNNRDSSTEKELKTKISEQEQKISELEYIINDLQAINEVAKPPLSTQKTDTEKAYENLSFSFKALASAAGKLAEENEKLKKLLDELKNCGSCKFLNYPFSKDPCKACIENEGLSKWKYNEE